MNLRRRRYASVERDAGDGDADVFGRGGSARGARVAGTDVPVSRAVLVAEFATYFALERR
jgi:hypothetical protein